MTDQHYPQSAYNQYPPPGYDPGGPGYGYQQPAPVQPKKGLGITAMVLGIVALVLAFVPVIAILSFILGPAAVVLGIIAFVKRNGHGQGIAGIITGALGFIIAILGFALFGTFISAVEEEPEAEVSEESEAEAAEEQAEEEAEASTAQEEEGEEPAPAEDPGDEGSRDNPLPIGEAVSSDEWEVTINNITRNADDEVAAENQFNDPSPEGSSYALVNITATYLGDDSEMPLLSTEVSYVSESGETVNAFDHLAIAPDEFDSMTELYNGGTEQGNVAIAIPDDDEGTIRVRLGIFNSEDYFFEAE